MNEENQPSLFVIKLNDTGIFYIRKFYKLSGVIFGLMLVVSLFSLLFDISSLISMRLIQDNTRFYLVHTIRVCLYMVIVGGNIWAGCQYFRFSRKLYRAIDSDNEELFNRSFRYIFQNAVVFTGILAVNLLADMLLLFSTTSGFL